MDRNDWHSKGSRRAVPLMLLGSLTIIGCGGDAEPAAEAVVEEEAAVEVPVMPEFTEIDAEQLQTGAAAFRGQVVRVNGVMVASLVGTQSFWIELPNKNPFLVRTEGETTVEPLQLVDVVGTVTEVNEGLVAGWVDSGSISETDKLIVEFATDFIEVEMVMEATVTAP